MSMSRILSVALLLVLLAFGLVPTTTLAAIPANDNFASAATIATLPYADTVGNQEATTEPGEPTCTGSIYRTLWYSLTAGTTNKVRIVATGTFTTVVGVYRVDGPAFGGLTTLACPSFQFPTAAVVSFTAGATYMIQIGQYFDDGGVNIGLQIAVVPPPANDDFATATSISSIPFQDIGVDIVAASTEPNEPRSCLGQETPKTVWYEYSPAASGSITAYADGPGNAAITAFTGASLDQLTSLGCQYNRAPFHVDAGQTYHIQVDAATGDISAWTIRVEQTPPVQLSIGFSPSDPSIFDAVTLFGQIFDPVGQEIASETWRFGDGSSGTGQAPTHRYGADGDYIVHLDLTTTDGRSAAADQTIQVRTHDVAVTKFTVPRSARSGQTRQITVGLSNTRHPEAVEVGLYKGNTLGGFDLIGTLTQSVLVTGANRTTPFSFNYTFTSADASIGKVTFKAVATIVSARDALPGDNEAIASPTKVTT